MSDTHLGRELVHANEKIGELRREARRREELLQTALGLTRAESWDEMCDMVRRLRAQSQRDDETIARAGQELHRLRDKINNTTRPG